MPAKLLAPSPSLVSVSLQNEQAELDWCPSRFQHSTLGVAVEAQAMNLCESLKGSSELTQGELGSQEAKGPKVYGFIPPLFKQPGPFGFGQPLIATKSISEVVGSFVSKGVKPESWSLNRVPR